MDETKELLEPVVLIGCGPGDPELMTVKAVKRLARAEVIVADRLAGAGVLAYAAPGAEIIDAGKTPGGRAMAQDEINRILVREGLKGRRVVRLKGGDGFVFGRAAEEMAALGAAGLSVEVIPGITSAHACAASIGLPLTLRESIRQFSVVTGATASGTIDLDWTALAKPGQAFAIYMGVGTSAHVMSKLLSAGANAATPVVIVENGTLASERAISTSLGAMAAAVAALDVAGPAIIFVGLSWQAANLTKPEKVSEFGGAKDLDAAGMRIDLIDGVAMLSRRRV